MYTFKILYSYTERKKTVYYSKLITVPRPEGVSEPITEAAARVRHIVAANFDGVTLLGVHFLYWENYVLRDDEKLSSVRALETLSIWIDVQRERAEDLVKSLEAK